jgi:RNA polymerase sigma-70 factor (ECF subfamily)
MPADRLAGDQAISEARALLTRAVERVCPAWLAAQRDDIVQAAALRVAAVLREGEGKARVHPSYLRKVAHSALVDEIRRVRARREIPLEEAANTMTQASPTPEQQATQRELGEGIRDCVARLQEARRRAVALHLLGHSVPDVGRLLGWDAKRAENLVYRGLEDVRRCLTSKGLDP